MSQSKVVSLSAAKPSSRAAAGLPPIVHTLRQHSRKQLASLLERLFNNVDDALFEMADRSRSDTDQHMYFESMRELRLKREAIGKAFVKAYSRGFDEAFLPVSKDDADDDADFENVSMLDNDELELSVAITGITSKVTSQYSLAIMQLTKRLDHLARHGEISERSNPMGPEKVSEHFVTALECAELDIKVRIILLKLFERFVMERLAAFYSDANQMLADAGVLTDLKSVLRRERAQATSADRTPPQPLSPDRPAAPGATDGGFYSTTSYGGDAPSAAQGGSGGTVGFSVIQELLAASRGVPGGTPAVPSTAAAGPPLATTDVLTALSDAQAELTAPIDVETVPAVLDLRQLVISRADSTGGGSAQLAQADDDTVHFVSMLFDYILNDRNLAIPMKALIGRLQLPIVRLALLDRSFFDRSNHPARQLLNELSSAGIGWSSARELKRDALYNKVESVVLRVMNGFTDDPAIFEELLDDLRSFVKSDRRKREQVEQRVRDNEQGRARTINAKQTAQKLINQKASGMRLPPEVGRFISDTWSKVLVYTCVKEGDRSSTWQFQVDVLDKLLWSLQPLENVDDLDRRDALIPELLDALREGMRTIQLPDAEIEKRIEQIESHLKSICANDRAYLDVDSPAPADETFEVMEEIVLTVPGEQLEPESEVPVEPQYVEQVNRLREGSWVELRQPTGELLRGKLSAIIEPGGRYVFVNRRGMKIAERSRQGLAVELKRGSLTILEESQVFDRALQAVIGNLRQMHRSSSG